jgi:hypothetical protein
VTPGHEKFFNWACDIADHFIPLTQEEEADAARRSEGMEVIFEAAA